MADKPSTKDATAAAAAEKAYADAAGSVKPAAEASPAVAGEAGTVKAATVKAAPVEKASPKKLASKPRRLKPAAAATSKAPVPAVAKAPVPAVAKAPVPIVAKAPVAPRPKAPMAAKASAATLQKPYVAPKVRVQPAPVEVAPPAKAPELIAPPSIAELKEKIMNTNDFTATMTETMSGAVAEVQAKMQEAYEKSTSMVTEITDFAKGNVDAMMESGKILAEGVQGMGKALADDAKSIYEVATADMKEMASIKSPTELFQLQGKIMRRNFDAMVANASKGTDAFMKLANDTVAPISGRVNLAAEKMSKVAA